MSEKQKIKNEAPIPCKIILVGESGVGKTSIISCYLDNYQGKVESTLGAYFSNKTIIVDGFQINLEIWDTAGQEQYRSINNLFYRDAHICLLVYDITNKPSFNNIKDYWYESVKENGLEGIIFGVAGNKSDLYEDEEVNENEAREFSDSINACFKLTSAELNSSIEDIFMMLGEKFIKSDFVKDLIPKYEINNEGDEEKRIRSEIIKVVKDDFSQKENNNKKKKNGCC